jgi:hypothetical protein
MVSEEPAASTFSVKYQAVSIKKLEHRSATVAQGCQRIHRFIMPFSAPFVTVRRKKEK